MQTLLQGWACFTKAAPAERSMTLAAMSFFRDHKQAQVCIGWKSLLTLSKQLQQAAVASMELWRAARLFDAWRAWKASVVDTVSNLYVFIKLTLHLSLDHLHRPWPGLALTQQCGDIAQRADL